MSDVLRILMLGDISGNAGKGALFVGLSSLVKETKADFIIANGENAADGFGIKCEDYRMFKSLGINVITSGNHIWQKDEIYETLESSSDLLRPFNYPDAPGRGWTIVKCGSYDIAVINAEGRVNMMPLLDPFKAMEPILREIKKKTNLIFVDFHAESAEEKEALGFYLDGRVTAVVGTHTHVQTRDEKILPKKTAYITDLGLTGVQGAVIGSSPEKSIERQLTQLPLRSEVAEGKGTIQGVIIECDAKSGNALSIKRISY